MLDNRLISGLTFSMNRSINVNLTRFQQSVYRAARKIPRGRVTTYKILAKHISATGRSACGGKCGSCRAVGQALRRNPYAPEVPCHRVIASDLSPGGFNGYKTGKAIKRKLKLLEAEGVRFKNGQLAQPALIYRYSRATS